MSSQGDLDDKTIYTWHFFLIPIKITAYNVPS